MSETKENTSVTRPFFFSVICFSIFIYSGFLSLLFLLALINNNWVTQILIEYFPEKSISSTSVFLLSSAFLVLNILSFSGTYLLWKMRRTGFFIFLFATLVIIALPFILGYGNLISSAILLIVVLLIAIYYNRLH